MQTFRTIHCQSGIDLRPETKISFPLTFTDQGILISLRVESRILTSNMAWPSVVIPLFFGGRKDEFRDLTSYDVTG